MKLATWNINSVRQRLAHVVDWLNTNEPDVLALQEIKCETAQFPFAALEDLGYRCLVEGQKAYNGVALLSRLDGTDVQRGLPDYEDPQRRLLAATYDGVRVINVYVPNGQSVGSEKFRYKLDWMDALAGYVARELACHEHLAIVGDFNVAPEDRDVHDPELWRERILCSTPEREKIHALLALGLKDAFRLFEQPDRTFSWWDYRMFAFRRNMGLRIDLILTSSALSERCSAVAVDRVPRALEKPSDHAPVVALL